MKTHTLTLGDMASKKFFAVVEDKNSDRRTFKHLVGVSYDELVATLSQALRQGCQDELIYVSDLDEEDPFIDRDFSVHMANPQITGYATIDVEYVRIEADDYLPHVVRITKELLAEEARRIYREQELRDKRAQENLLEKQKIEYERLKKIFEPS